MGIAHEAARAVGGAMRNVHAGRETLVSRRIAGPMAPRIRVTSPDLPAHGELPVSSTVEASGTARPPTLEWIHVPEDAQSIVLICEDPDAPFPDPFVHWMVYGIPVTTTSIEGGRAGANAAHAAQGVEGKNSKLTVGFAPAAPPPGHGVHHYFFQVFALDTAQQLDAGLGRNALVDHLKDHVVGWGELVGTYERR